MVIFALGLFLRIYGCLSVHYFSLDEDRWRSLAEEISFVPATFHLVIHGDHHPCLEVYIIKLSTILFNKQFFTFLPAAVAARASYRLLQVLLCSTTILVIYRLAYNTLGKQAALVSSFLLAVSQFHIHLSRTIVQIGPLLFFAAVSLLFFWKSLTNNKFILLTGASLGLAYLSEESAAFLLMIFVAYLLFTRRLLRWLHKWETYAAILIFAILISPDLYWNFTTHGSNMIQHLGKAGRFNGISLLSTSLYLGELFLWFAPDINALIGGIGKGHVWPLEYPPMNWVLGIICLVAVLAAVYERRNDFVRFMLTVFAFVFFFFTIFASKGPLGNFSYYWASISTIPAIILAGALLSKMLSAQAWARWLSGLTFAYLTVSAVAFLSLHDQIYIRNPIVLGQFYTNLAEENVLRGNYQLAAVNLEKALTYVPESRAARVNLMECYKNGAKAKGQLLPLVSGGNDVNQRYLFDRGYIKEWMVGQWEEGGKDQGRSQGMFIAAGIMKESGHLDIIKSGSAIISSKRLQRPRVGAITYAYTSVYAPKTRPVRLWLMADGGASIWIDGEKVYEKEQGKLLWIADQDEIVGMLKKGWNELVLRLVSQGGRNFGFSVKITAENGDIIDGIMNLAEPVTELERK